MILEVATIGIKPGMNAEFETAFAKARLIIAGMPGCMRHELQKCVETPDQYILFVHWRTLEDHMIGFRESPQFKEWRALLGGYFNAAPVVQHYTEIFYSDHAIRKL